MPLEMCQYVYGFGLPFVVMSGTMRDERAVPAIGPLDEFIMRSLLDDDAARFAYAKLKFEQENAVRASEKRPKRGEK